MDRRSFIRRLPPFVIGSAVAVKQAPSVIERMAEEARYANLPSLPSATAEEVRSWLVTAASGLQRFVANPYPVGSSAAAAWRVLLDQKIIDMAHNYAEGTPLAVQEAVQIIRSTLGIG